MIILKFKHQLKTLPIKLLKNKHLRSNFVLLNLFFTHKNTTNNEFWILVFSFLHFFMPLSLVLFNFFVFFMCAGKSFRVLTQIKRQTRIEISNPILRIPTKTISPFFFTPNIPNPQHYDYSP